MQKKPYALLAIPLLWLSGGTDDESELRRFLDSLPRTDPALCAENWSLRLTSVHLTPETIPRIEAELQNELPEPVVVIPGLLNLGRETTIWSCAQGESYTLVSQPGLHTTPYMDAVLLRPGETLSLTWGTPVFEDDDGMSYGVVFARFKKRYHPEKGAVRLEAGDYVVDTALRFTVHKPDLQRRQEIGRVTVISDNKLCVRVSEEAQADDQ